MKRKHKIFYLLFPFLLYHLLMTVFHFLGKNYEKSNANLFCSYNIISSLFKQFRLAIEHNKLEVFYFSRTTKNFYSPSLNLGWLKGPLLWPKDKWRYLSFIFDCKSSFYHHIHFYFNKTLSTIKKMKMLGNFTRELSLSYK